MKRKISFQKLVNRYSYNITLRLDVFAWMVKTGWGFRHPAGYTLGSDSGVFEWLYDLSSIGSQDYYYSYSVGKRYSELDDFLRLAFVRAIVDSSAPESVQRWREKEKVFLCKYRMLDFVKTNGIKVRDLNWLFYEVNGARLVKSLNKYHPDAKTVLRVDMCVSQRGFDVMLVYGFMPGDSQWRHALCVGEPSSHQAVYTASNALRELLL